MYLIVWWWWEWILPSPSLLFLHEQSSLHCQIDRKSHTVQSGSGGVDIAKDVRKCWIHPWSTGEWKEEEENCRVKKYFHCSSPVLTLGVIPRLILLSNMNVQWTSGRLTWLARAAWRFPCVFELQMEKYHKLQSLPVPTPLSLSVHATATDASTINSLHLVITRIPLTRNPNSNVSSAYTTHISYRPHIWVRGEQEKKTNKIKYTLFHVDWIDSEWLKVAYIVDGLDVQNGISPAGTSGGKEVNCTILSKIETYLRKKSLRILKFNREILAHSVVPIGFHNPFIHRTYCYSPTRILYTQPRPPNAKLLQPFTRKNVIIPV